MSAIVIAGDTSGTCTIQANAVAGTTTLTLPTTSGVLYATPTGGVINAANGGTGLSSVGASGNVLTSNGTTWVSSAPAAFDSGTVMLFGQTAAPTGWTKDTTNYNNSGLRVVTGSASTGGTVDFTTAFASQTPTITISAISGSAGSTTLSTPQIPSHLHGSLMQNGYFTGGVFGVMTGSDGTSGRPVGDTTSTGGGGSHTHPFSFSSGTATSSAINLAVKYVDVIRATKN